MSNQFLSHRSLVIHDNSEIILNIADDKNAEIFEFKEGSPNPTNEII